MLYNKKGALTTRQIVLLVILITSFLVILFFIFRLNLGQETKKQTCHNTVTLKGSTVLPSESVQLNCKTSYVCITADGSCEKMSSYDYRKVVKTKEEMYFTLAEEMAECWWMFGEGKINYVGKDFLKKNYCSICSQLTFDDSVKTDIPAFASGKIDKDGLMDYLSKTRMSGQDITYAEYLYGTKDVQKLLGKEGTGFGNINLDKTHAVLMGIRSKTDTLGWILVGTATVVVIAAITVATAGAGLVVGAIIVGASGAAGGVLAGTVVAPVVDGLSGNEYISPSIIEYPSQIFDGLDCARIETLA